MVTENTIMHLSNIITDNTCMLNIRMLLHQVEFLSTCTKSMTSTEQVSISQMQALSSLEMIVQDYGWMANT